MRVRITNNGYATVTLSKIKKDKKIYAEINSMIACSTKLVRSMCLANGESYEVPKRFTTIGKFTANMKAEAKQSFRRKATKEEVYVLYEALEDCQKVTFKSCFPGMILMWDVSPMAQGEFYDMDLSALHSVADDENMLPHPHGTIIAVRGAFLAAEMSVRMGVYKTNNIRITSASKTGGIFQHFSGTGMVLLEAHGDLIEIPLYPFESVDVWPGNLLAFTEGVQLKMQVSGDMALRGEENEKEVIRLTAPEQGGFVYVKSVTDIELPVLIRDNSR